MNTKLISLIVPCYNEELSIPIFYNSFIKLTNDLANKADFELIFINDGSCDKTFNIIKNIAKDDIRVKYISFSRNFGKEAAMFAGLESSKGDYAVIADADLQHPLEMIIEMFDIISEGFYDCVAAKRTSREGDPPIRSFFSNQFYNIINKFSKSKIISGATDFRLMSRSMINSILELKEYNRFSKGLFSFVGYETKWLEYRNVERVAGKSTWSFWSLFKYSVEGLLAFTTTPLHVASILGLFICFFSFLFIAYIAIDTIIYGNPVAGYPTIVCIVTFMGGIQLFCIGILSEYVSKIYSEVKKRPIYIVKESNIKK